jgi:hypothetical protein
VSNVNGQLRFAAANDNTNSLDVWTFNTAVAGHHGHHRHGSDDDGHGSDEDDED